LQEYVLISADKIGLDCFRLNEKGLWELHPSVEDDEVHLVSVDFTFPLSLVYEDVF
jgi:Uma2 family endonuclease